MLGITEEKIIYLLDELIDLAYLVGDTGSGQVCEYESKNKTHTGELVGELNSHSLEAKLNVEWGLFSHCCSC